jgi:CheY-like chemotaxis protein
MDDAQRTTKPGDADTLRYAQQLARLTRASLLQRDPQAGARAEDAPTPRVLVADDNPLSRGLLAATLSLAPFEVVDVATGAQAFALLVAEHPLVAILDGGMPEPNGYTLCGRIKADPTLSDIRVIIVSTAPRDERRAWDAGADGYLTKPFGPARLLGTIAALLAPPRPPGREEDLRGRD